MKVVIADVCQDYIDKASAYFKNTDFPVHFIKMDVTDRPAWAAAADETEKIFGSTPDLLIMTAGVNTFGPVEASTYEDFDWVAGVNLGGVINGLITFVPKMIKAGRGGHIAATVSYGAFIAAPIVAPYTSSKMAVLNLLESYYMALKQYNIGVSALCPANINTDIPYSPFRTRPEHLKETGYNVTDATIAQLMETQVHGMDPRVLAGWLKKGIENEQYLIVPYEHAERMVELEFARFVDYTTLEGQKRREEMRKQPPTEEMKMLELEKEGTNASASRQTRPVDVGFGKARADKDWVLPERRFIP